MMKAVNRPVAREHRHRKTIGHAGTATGMGRDKFFNIHCKLEPTGEKFMLKNIHLDMKIKDLKSYAEFITGIPMNLQRLCYLDEGDLIEHTDVRHNDIIPGALIHMKVWNTWRTLIEAVVSGDTELIFSLGVTGSSDFRTPSSDYMASQNPKIRQEWLDERAFVALYIASHRGNQRLCAKLLESGANVNAQTPYGRSPLHVAAARGHGSIVDLLLEKGADIDASDSFGDTPLTVAEKFGNKGCERHLFLFRWQQRAKQTLKNKMQVDMFAHQYFDSTNPVWLKGQYAQIYLAQILPPGEYEGTSFSAPLRRIRPGTSSGDCRALTSSDCESDSEGEEEVYRLGDTKMGQLRRGPRQPDMMPAIKEETSSNSNSDNKEKSKHKDKHGRHQRRAQSGKTFDDWLRKKKTSEQMKIRAKKEEERAKQVLIEEQNREEELKKSFLDWQIQQEAASKRSITTPVPSIIECVPNATTTAEIIQNIMTRKQEQYNNHDDPSNMWQSVHEKDFYHRIRAKGSLLAKQY